MTVPAAGSGEASPAGFPPPPDTTARSLGAALARAAVAIAVVTVLARLLGFGRVVVFSQTVGAATCLGSTYYTANAVPNIVFEVVAGGALASLVVPVLAGAVERGDREAASRTASALLTWTVLVLAPLALLAAALARPLLRLLYAPAAAPGTPSCDVAAVVDLGARMLVVFAPQVVLYGVALVLTGVLQAHRRFLGPALAPLLSSVVVIGAYLTYARLPGAGGGDVRGLSTARELALSAGTTLGVAALALPLFVPLRRTGIRLRPALHFPPGIAQRVRRLAAAGAAVLAAQQAALVVVVRLADGYAPQGGIVLYTLAWTMFLVPWAVLAVPIATSAFPLLAGRAEARDDAGFAAVSASSTRAVVLVTAVSAAALAAAAEPLARVLLLGTPGTPDPPQLARGLVAFAPGLVGYGLVAALARALYARGRGRAAATATIAGWFAVAVADLGLVPAAEPGWVIAALGAGNSLGMTVAGVLLLLAVGRATDGGGLAGLGRTGAAAAAGAVAGWAAGLAVAGARGEHGVAGSLLDCALVGGAVLAAYLGIVLLLDRGSLRALLAGRRAGRLAGG